MKKLFWKIFLVKTGLWLDFYRMCGRFSQEFSCFLPKRGYNVSYSKDLVFMTGKSVSGLSNGGVVVDSFDQVGSVWGVRFHCLFLAIFRAHFCVPFLFGGAF